MLLALVVGVAASWWSWRERLNHGPERAAAAARALAIAAVVLLLLDPGIAGRVARQRPVVLLDNSVSMHARGGQATAAARLAASLGDTVTFGELVAGEPGSRVGLGGALAAAMTGGRRVVLVTDGEIADTAAIPPAVRAALTVHVLPRAGGPDQALTEVRAPSRLSVGDTLWVEVAAQRTPDAADSVRIEVRSGAELLMAGTLRFGTAVRGRIRLASRLPGGFSGAHWVEVVRSGAADSEPGDDIRWLRLTVAPSPAVVVLAASPDWDARFLYQTLRDVIDAPVRGYAQLERGSWRRMDDLRRVSTAEVLGAARAADLLAVRGDVTAWQRVGHARLLWAPSALEGDWYVGGGGASPVAGAFVGVPLDSLPPAIAVTPLDNAGAAEWVGATAQLARRGAAVPILTGTVDPGGRVVRLGADGLYRWAFRGGVADQLWRGLIASAAAWLLAAPRQDGARAIPIQAVTERGRPVRFRWTAPLPAVPLAVQLDGGDAVRHDTLSFDAAGEAAIALPPGRYRYTLEGGASGQLAVEPYSDELLPAAVTLVAHEATVAPTPTRGSLREAWWLFALAAAGFILEWLLRRRFGLR
ncbi:MAG: hypothetical protein ABJC19_01220 [Gemmatimonadota bacterium]